MALIILEGCDGSGKTTLTDEIVAEAERLGHGVIQLHKGPPDPNRHALIEYLDDLAFYRPRREDQQVVVCDRWHLGEFVYGPIYRGRSQLSRRQLDVIDTYVDSMGALKVILDAPDEVLAERAFGRDGGEDFIDRRHIKRIASEYRDLAHRPGWVTRDTTTRQQTLAHNMLVTAFRKEGHVVRDFEEAAGA